MFEQPFPKSKIALLRASRCLDGLTAHVVLTRRQARLDSIVASASASAACRRRLDQGQPERIPLFAICKECAHNDAASGRWKRPPAT
jgi:hypothetical protein